MSAKPKHRMTSEEHLQSIEMILKKFIREQNQHNQKMNVFVANQELINTRVTDDLDEVKRGVYGDKKNKVLGLLDRQGNVEKGLSELKEATEKDIRAIKSKQTKLGRVAAGIVIGFNAAIFLVKEFLFGK